MDPLDGRELAGVLAGLRLLQRSLDRGEGLPYGIDQIYRDAGAGLNSVEIDHLCEWLNISSYPVKTRRR